MRVTGGGGLAIFQNLRVCEHMVFLVFRPNPMLHFAPFLSTHLFPCLNPHIQKWVFFVRRRPCVWHFQIRKHHSHWPFLPCEQGEVRASLGFYSWSTTREKSCSTVTRRSFCQHETFSRLIQPLPKPICYRWGQPDNTQDVLLKVKRPVLKGSMKNVFTKNVLQIDQGNLINTQSNDKMLLKYIVKLRCSTRTMS